MAERREAIRSNVRQRDKARSDPRLAWWRAARFGMFIHWGLYAIPAGTWKGQQIPGIGEWIMHRARIPVSEYEQLARQFDPVKFDADEWASLAKRAGQKYMLITAKHHDGFCMFRTQMTGYNIVDATPYGRDPMAELAEACERHGIKFGFYYSQTQDWHHPNGDGNDWDYDEGSKDFSGYIESYVKPQVRELLTQYGPIAVVWFDTPKRMTTEQSQSLLGLVHQLQPECLVSGRLGNALGDYAEAGDNRYPEKAQIDDWETPATINDTWAFKSYDHNWKSSGEMIRKLVDGTSKNGNYLLNVGPTARGVIPRPSVERLEAMGRWLGCCGESVYGTTPGPVQELDWCRSTARSGVVYLHVFEWPQGGEIQVKGLPSAVTSARLLNDVQRPALELRREGDRVVISGPPTAPDPDDTVLELS